MSDTPVLVHRLRLQAGRDAPVQALRARVEDALRTSSKPALLAHRFVLLRRLRLRLPQGASAQSLALQLQAQWRAIEALAQPIEQAGDTAEAVWADDEVQARLALLRRWLQAASTSAWFWPRLLPGLRADAPLPQRLQRLLFEPLAAVEPEAEAAMQRRLWCEAWRVIDAAAQVPQLLQRCTAAQAAALMRGVGPSLASRDQVPVQREPATADAAPGVEVSPPPLDGARRPQGRAVTKVPHPADAALLPESADHAAVLAAAAAAPPADPAPPGPQVATRQCTGIEPVQPPPVTATAPAEAQPCDGLPQPTDWAGTWFLLPMLRQLRLDEEPDAAATLAALLRALSQRHALDAPVQRWVVQHLPPADALPSPDRAAHWQRALRLHALQLARLPLRRVLQRPGRVLLAPHRVDVLLPLAQADIRLRRAGFDLDPGYLPWLDGIVRFHYA